MVEVKSCPVDIYAFVARVIRDVAGAECVYTFIMIEPAVS